MSGDLIGLIPQLVAGSVGGNAAGSALKNLNLGSMGNTIAGALVASAAGSLSQCLPEPPVAGLISARSISQLEGGADGALLAVIAGS